MKKIILLLLIAFLCMAFVPVTPEESAKNNAAVEIAIKDFLKTRHSKKHEVFTIYLNDASNDMIALSIFNPLNKFYIDLDVDTLGMKHYGTRHVIKNKKLFYWDDPNYGLTQELVDALYKYDQLDTITLENGVVVSTGGGASMHYFFCKNDLSVYKQVFTRFPFSWYKSHPLRCVNSSGEKMPVEYKQPKPFSVQ